MEYINEFAAVPAIAIITYLIAEIFKVIANSRENWLLAAFWELPDGFVSPDISPLKTLLPPRL